ncbi:phage tail protein [Deinococcus arcticus]|uniref:Phage tail protein n=1 Tax=Deinococcus arcticus TaxID=2136176 RepID=A0A2T3W9J5_9DEIO|nr:tail fiber protein [Deinococcus arcticus]PTA68507.1 phage tail protein [Deinococcus arcticus]
MDEPFIGTIQICALPFAPRGWATCDGQLLPINQNQALFSILGTTYGGNGQTNFALPDLRGRVPMHWGTQGGLPMNLGQAGGQATHTLTLAELPAHSHALGASASAGSTSLPAGALLASAPLYAAASSPLTALANTTVGSAGGSQPHPNLPPLSTLNFVIALVGIFPSRN